MLRSGHGRSRRTRAGVLGSALLAGAVWPAAGLRPGPASAAAACVTTAGTTTCTFPYTGTAASWPVPPGVTSLTVVADGGAGGAARDVVNNGAEYVYPPGGPGGQYKATLTGIPAGTTLSIFPGGSGSGGSGGADAGHGGGHGGAPILIPTSSGGGGGASTVAIAPFSVARLLVVAGGGGGTANNGYFQTDLAGGAAAAAATSTAARVRTAACRAAEAAAVPPPRAAPAAPNPAAFPWARPAGSCRAATPPQA